jgi:hypothetical protein
MIAEGRALVRRCLRLGRPGPYQIQAAIQAVHTDPPTDWSQVVALYDQLMAVAGSVAALNRAVAVAEVAGPAAAPRRGGGRVRRGVGAGGQRGGAAFLRARLTGRPDRV